jgi:polysaccharide deacetylase 2 family uncharacterized protein YibQ
MATVSPGRARPALQSTLPEALAETTKELEALWAEDACETILIKKKGYPLASVACNGSYTASQRAKFVDILLRNFFTVKKENYKLRPQNGMYLYKTKYGNDVVYFKLFVRNAFDLWPKNPVQGKQVALYVQNVRASADLVKWRTLGVPLTFGVTLGRGDSKELMQQVSSYGDEVWLAIPLEDENTDIADGNLLTINEALDSEKLAEYLSILDDDDGIAGASPLYCSRFCKNVPALRALFSALRDKNDGKELVLLDADHHVTSSFYETGRIMNFRTFRAQVMPDKKNNFCSTLESFAARSGENVSRVMAVDAADDTAFRCLKKISRSAKADVDFVKVSSLSVTNPFK